MCPALVVIMCLQLDPVCLALDTIMCPVHDHVFRAQFDKHQLPVARFDVFLLLHLDVHLAEAKVTLVQVERSVGVPHCSTVCSTRKPLRFSKSSPRIKIMLMRHGNAQLTASLDCSRTSNLVSLPADGHAQTDHGGSGPRTRVLPHYKRVRSPVDQAGDMGSNISFLCMNQLSEGTAVLSFEQGLPHLTVPLPSRRELCRFPLRPVTHTVETLVKHLQTEDRGIDRVLVRTMDGIRIASSASIESLLLADFDLVINDVTHRVVVPEQARRTTEELTNLSDVRQLVNKLYAALHVDEHQVARERDIIQEIEEIRTQLIPLEKQRSKLVSAAERRTSVIMYCGLGYMALQFGFLARLTWWEYSWDIMEPVTYFVTYGTAIACYAYYVLTKHDFLLPEVRDRQFLLGFHRKARKTGMDVGRYNRLKDRLFALESDLRRLRDPLALNLPPERLAKIIAEDASQSTLKTSTFSALQEQLKSLLKMRH
ncbi:Coiled-coil domain containing protein 109 C-terminal [Trinorchestia longiramus]|nr:Coiled-coil domain containing protein 109 C-terminal [Trinorchestia longiramus]